MVSFAIINTLFWVLDSIVWMESFDIVLLIKTYIASWLGNTVAYPLWYVPMYCSVVIVCPLLRKVVKNCWVRFFVWVLIGLVQRWLSMSVTWLGSYPFIFVSYPVFFELGYITYTKNWKKYVSKFWWIGGIYIIMVGFLSWWKPDLSVSAMVKYCVYYMLGIFVFYSLSIMISQSKALYYLGKQSYPLFLLHEPVIGRFIGNRIINLGINSSSVYVLIWFVGVLIITLFFISLLQKIKVDRVLWKYELPNY